jgi:peroxiredoxin
MARKPSPAAIAAIAALAAFTVFITWKAKRLETGLEGPDATEALINKPAPPFSLSKLDGTTVSLADYRGKKVVVSFWASWCGPCRMEMPVLRAFYEKNHKLHDNFEILAVSLDDNRRDPEEYAESLKLSFPVLLDLDSATGKAYGAESIPTLYVIDESGTVRYGQVGFDPSLELQLYRQLGIKPRNPFGVTDDGESSH